MGEPLPLEIPPGITNIASKAARTTNWRAANLVRWDQGVTLRPIGGWDQLYFSGAAVSSPIRKMHRWMTNDGHVVTAYLCEAQVFVEWEGTLIDVTPVGGMVPVPTNNGGFGDYLFGELEFGTARPGNSRLRSYTPAYSMDNWGEQLRAMTSSDGRLLSWDPATPTAPMVAVPNAPINNRSFSVTPERHIMLFGMDGNYGTFGWCDEEDDENWEFTNPLSKAGKYDQFRSPIVAHQRFDGGQTMHTLQGAFVIRWVGMPFIYAYTEIGNPAVPVSAQSLAEIPDGVIWPSVSGFWLYNGSSVQKVDCPAWDWVLEYINFPDTLFQSNVIHVRNFSELWWFFVDKNGASTETAKGLCLDYRAGIWSMLYFGRSAGFVYGNDTNPVMAQHTTVWKHETGFNYPGADMPFLETFNLNRSGGSTLITLKKVMPEVVTNPQALRFSTRKKNKRAGGTDIATPQRAIKESGYAHLMETGRDLRLRIDMVTNENWTTFGPMLVDSVQRGQR